MLELGDVCWMVVPNQYCSSGLRVEPLFHVEAVPSRALLRGITGMGWPCTYPPGIFPTHPCRELGSEASGRIRGEFLLRGSTDGPIFDGACHDVCLCNLPSSIDLDAIEHLQYHALLDHAHKNISFHGS